MSISPFFSLFTNISQFLHNQTSVPLRSYKLLSLLLHKIPHDLIWNNHSRYFKQKQRKHSLIRQDLLIVLYFTALFYACHDFFWNFKQKDQGTAAVLFMILAIRMDITKVFLIISQTKRKTRAKQEETHHTRMQQHTVQMHIRRATDQTGTPISSPEKKASNGGENSVILGIQQQNKRDIRDNTADKRHRNTHIRTAKRRSWRGGNWKKHNLCITAMDKLGIGKALVTPALQRQHKGQYRHNQDGVVARLFIALLRLQIPGSNPPPQRTQAIKIT